MTFGQRITLARREKKITQAQLGAAIGTTGDMVGKYERDAIKPSIEAAAKIAEALNCSLDYLVRDIQSNEEKKEVISQELLLQFKKLEKMTDTDKDHIFAVIEAFNAKAKIQSITE